MNTTTLQGIFPEPKRTYRRNFIKENVKSIKQMQTFLQEAGVIQPRPPREDKYQNVPPSIKSKSFVPSKQDAPKFPKKSNFSNLKLKLDENKESMKKGRPERNEVTEKFTHRSMQTEHEDMSKLYETGVIKYPSPGVVKSRAIRSSPQRGTGDANRFNVGICSVEKDLQNLEIDDKEGKDYIRENMSNLKPKSVRQCFSKVPAQAPPTYQRGVVPKYLRDRKDGDHKEEEDESCPDGHVLLPEEERKETLRVLRQSYADRIQELNSLPVRSDTLRIKRRKMEIEEELKRIDGGIKVFQRPKVYVKINA